jgi:hypothetical protein
MKMRPRRVILLGLLLCVAVLIAFFAYSGGNKPGLKPEKTLAHSPGNTTYYVDSAGGNDERDGSTPENAWKTLDRVNGVLFAPGDRILLRAGSRFSGQLAPWGSGNEGAPIVVDRYGAGGKPRIDAGARFHEALLLENQEYWEVNNLELTNQGWLRRGYRYGVRVAAWDFGTMHHIHLKNLLVRDVNGSVRKGRAEGQGILWENGGKKKPSRFDDLLIEGCHLLRTDRNGICGYSENSDRQNWFPSLRVVIRGNLLEDIGGDGIKPWGCDGVLVEHNRLDGANRRAPDYSAGLWPWSCDNAVFQFNEVSGVHGTRDGQAFDSDGNCRNAVFQYNYSHDNDGGFLLICDDGAWAAPGSAGNVHTVVRYNISQNDGARTFHLTGPVKDVWIYNNVFYVGPGLDVPLFLFTDYHGWADGVHVANNIFYAAGTFRYGQGVSKHLDGSYETAPGFGESTNVQFEDNVYFGHHVNPPEDSMALQVDPLLVNPGSGRRSLGSLEGYKLKESSPCIRAGVPIAENGGRDFWGNKVREGEKPAIGAHQKE